MAINWLKSNWLNLLTKLNADLLAGEAVFKDLEEAHSDSARHYHNLNHVGDLLIWIESVRLAESLPTIELAAWFHDYVYDSRRQDNEIKSAICAEETLTRLNVAPDIIQTVKQIILSTQKHQPLIESIDNLIFLDLDLAILAASSDRYFKYAAAIRKEYSWLSDRDYRQGRKQVLNSFLARNNIYYTDYFDRRWEQQARANLAREILLL